MEKKIEDFLHLYLGCEVMEVGNNRGKLYAIGLLGGDGKYRALVDCSSNDSYWTSLENLKPLLRKLSSMSEEERKEHRLLMYGEVDMANQIYSYAETPDSFHYLLSKGFDLFGLVDAGLAIDLNTLNTQS